MGPLPAHPQTPVSPQDAHDRLAALFASLTRLSADHRLLCAAATPDKVAIGAVRWQIARAGRERMELLTDTVFPLLERRHRGPDLAAMQALRASGIAYRRQVSDYVARWSTSAILADWNSYRRESDAFRIAVTTRLALEKALLLPMLRNLPAGEEPPAPRR